MSTTYGNIILLSFQAGSVTTNHFAQFCPSRSHCFRLSTLLLATVPLGQQSVQVTISHGTNSWWPWVHTSTLRPDIPKYDWNTHVWLLCDKQNSTWQSPPWWSTNQGHNKYPDVIAQTTAVAQAVCVRWFRMIRLLKNKTKQNKQTKIYIFKKKY